MQGAACWCAAAVAAEADTAGPSLHTCPTSPPLFRVPWLTRQRSKVPRPTFHRSRSRTVNPSRIGWKCWSRPEDENTWNSWPC